MKVLENAVTKVVTTKTLTKVLQTDEGELIAILQSSFTAQNPLGNSQMRIVSQNLYEEHKELVKSQYEDFLVKVSRVADEYPGTVTVEEGDDLGMETRNNPVIFA